MDQRSNPGAGDGSSIIAEADAVLGTEGPLPMVEEKISVLPIPGDMAASATDEVEEDATGATVEPAPTGRSSSRVRKAVAMFDPSPAKKARVEAPSVPIPTGARGAALERIRTNQVGPRSYLAANEILLPIAMREYPPDATSLLAVDRTSLDAFFTKGLTDVCDSVFGPRLTKRLAVEFTSKPDTLSIRNFFELMNAGPQCIGVLSEEAPEQAPRPAILEYCWICGTKADDLENPKECEHKFSILPALVVTGLYDSRLRKALGADGLRVYQKQLVSEYAYAHRRCNQVKSDVVFASLRYVGNNPRIVQCGTNPDAVQATLNDILTRAATTYTPQPDALREKFRVESLWDGLSPTATDPATPDDASWITARTQRVGQSMMAAAAKFNSKNLPAFVVKTHIVNAMLTRAIELSPQLVGEELWDSLTPEGQAMVTRSLGGARGGRRKTRRSRKGTRRVMRGGEGDADIWVDLVSSIVKEARLKNLATALETAFAGTTTPEDYNMKVMKVFADHVAKTDMEINDALGTMTIDGLATFLPVEGDGAGGPIRRTISAVRMSGPLPPPVNTAPPSGTLASTQGFDEGEESASGNESQMSQGFASPPRTTTAASSGTPQPGTPPPNNGSAQGLGVLVSPPVKPPTNRGGFKFTMGKRPDWL
jgi:hypothetical protein